VRLNPEVPAKLEDTINRLLEKDRHLRYQSAADLRSDLKRLKRDSDSGRAGSHRAVAEDSESSGQEKAIVVMPFENISPEAEQEYFCDGMTEEIITDLSQIRSLRVISRTSAMRLKGIEKNIATISRDLNVQYVLAGGVRKAGNNLRITAQLIEGASDRHLWAQKYSGTLEDVFDIQEQVSRSIVEALALELSPEDDRRLAERPIENVHAYECYLRARQETWRFCEEGLERALELIRSGLELAGDNAVLFAARGTVYWQYINIGVDPRQNDHYLTEAEEGARRALELDPQSCQGYVLRGLIFNKRGMTQEAVKHLKRALVIDPDDPDALYWLALLYSLHGKAPAARPLAARYLEVDPLTNFSFIVGWLDYVEGNLEAGLEPFRRTYAMAPNDIGVRWVYAIALAGAKRSDELSRIVDSLAVDAPTNPLTVSVLFLKHALLGNKDEALRVVTPEFEAACRWDEVLPWMLAGGYAMIDQKEQAYHWLEYAFSRGFINYPFLSQYDPFLENLRGEDRFKQLMERVKREWEHFEV
jgi:non-specific serine/threonine protein kinase